MIASSVDSSLTQKLSFDPPELDVIQPPWVVHDRVQEFVVHSKILLCRPLEGERRNWRVVSLPYGCVPYQVKADFEDVMVLNTKGYVHYAKSLVDGVSAMPKFDWHEGIWDLPVISAIFNRIIYEYPNFKVYDGESWSCSFLEGGCDYVDGAGRRHELGSGVGEIGATTTAFVGDNKHRVFRFYDPFLPKTPEDKELFCIPYPETPTTTFELKGMASCRSQIFAIGYDVRANGEDGVVKKLALYLISADANLLGLNPMISYTYENPPPRAADFILPAVTYRKIPLPACLSLTSVVGVERLHGSLMTDVALTVEGKMLNGTRYEFGYFYMRLCDQKWVFKRVGSHRIDEASLLQKRVKKPDEHFTTNVVDYFGKTDGDQPAELLSFGKNSLESTIKVTINMKTYELKLYRKPSKWEIIDFPLEIFTLVASPEVAKVLGWNKTIFPVKVQLKNGVLYIKDGRTPLFDFRVFY